MPRDNFKEPNVNNYDRIQMRPVEDGRLLLKIRDSTGLEGLMAATSFRHKDPKGETDPAKLWNTKSPDVIIINPACLQDHGFPLYSKQLVDNARLDTVNKAAARAAGEDIEVSIDLLNTLELTLLHEVGPFALLLNFLAVLRQFESR